MKKRAIPFLFILLTLSCNILDQEPQNALDADLAFESERMAKAAVTGVYDALQEEYYYGGWLQFSADNYADVSIYFAFELGWEEMDSRNIPTFNSNITFIWISIYATINAANEAIYGINNSTDPNFTKEERNELLGQVRAIRALCYLDLLTYWGEHWDESSTYGIPLVSEPNFGDYYSIEMPIRSSVAETYQFIIDDLTYAESVLSGNTDRTRINLGTVKAILARTYLFKKDYVNAERYATDVIINSNYALVADVQDIYYTDLSTESILELVYSSNDPSDFAEYAIRRDDVLPDPVLLASFEPGDERRELIQKLEERGGKDRFFKAEDYATDTNPAYVFRIAEMYLARAEARFFLNDQVGALADLNAVRTRAGLSDHLTADNFINKLLDEIWWEFFAEGGRFASLVRLGKAQEILGIDDFRRVYPIPQQEINVKGTSVVQNPGYN